MTKPKFNNRQNGHVIHKIQEGNKLIVDHEYWISRAPAVVGVVFAFGAEGGTRVLIIKRSAAMRDEPNKFAAPSGYLDWDETGFEGITREMFEETSMYLKDYEPFLVFDNKEQPFYVHSDPKTDMNQNVSLSYVLAYDFSNSPDFFPEEIEKYTNEETAEVKWLNLKDFYNNNLEWAFNHDQRIKAAYEFLMKNYVM